jgi:hypothetical protein
MRSALVAWSEHLQALVDGGRPKVVTFPQKVREGG